MKIMTTSQLIEQNSIRLYLNRTVSQNLYNEGNKEHLEREKKRFLRDLIDEETELIKVTKNYPVNDIQDIELEADLILIDKKKLDQILKNVG